MPEPPKLITLGILAEHCNTTPARVARLLRNRPHIRPAAYAGHVRLFNSTAIAQVRYELNKIDAQRTKRGAE